MNMQGPRRSDLTLLCIEFLKTGKSPRSVAALCGATIQQAYAARAYLRADRKAAALAAATPDADPTPSDADPTPSDADTSPN